MQLRLFRNVITLYNQTAVACIDTFAIYNGTYRVIIKSAVTIIRYQLVSDTKITFNNVLALSSSNII